MYAEYLCDTHGDWYSRPDRDSRWTSLAGCPFPVAPVGPAEAERARLAVVIGRAIMQLDLSDVYSEVHEGAVPIGLSAEHYRSMVDFMGRVILLAREILAEVDRVE